MEPDPSKRLVMAEVRSDAWFVQKRGSNDDDEIIDGTSSMTRSDSNRTSRMDSSSDSDRPGEVGGIGGNCSPKYPSNAGISCFDGSGGDSCGSSDKDFFRV